MQAGEFKRPQALLQLKVEMSSAAYIFCFCTGNGSFLTVLLHSTLGRCIHALRSKGCLLRPLTKQSVHVSRSHLVNQVHFFVGQEHLLKISAQLTFILFKPLLNVLNENFFIDNAVMTAVWLKEH